MADIIELLLSDHERILRLQTALSDVARYHSDAGPAWALPNIWDRLATLIELHIEAEEEICFLAMFGTSPAGQAQMQAAIAEHDDIREALGEARLQPVGSAGWWKATKDALSAWVEQIDQQERGVLADFARRAGRAERDALGRQWSAFITARRGDLAPHAQHGGAACQMCQWPIPVRHRHVIDTDHCAIVCTCPTCYELFHQSKDRQDHGGCPGPAICLVCQRFARAQTVFGRSLSLRRPPPQATWPGIRVSSGQRQTRTG